MTPKINVEKLRERVKQEIDNAAAGSDVDIIIMRSPTLIALLDYIEKANEALVFYGDKRNWVLKRTITASGGVSERISERGKLARAALAEWEERFE